MNLHRLNGSNNKNLIPEFQLDTWKGSYVSTARTVNRQLWMLDFLEIFYSLLYEDRTATLKDCAKEAYNLSFGVHYSWPKRAANKIGMISLPTREDFLKDTKQTYD